MKNELNDVCHVDIEGREGEGRLVLPCS